MLEIKNYCLYYIPKSSEALKDTLMVYFGGNKQVDSRQAFDNYIVLKSKNEIVAYAFLNMSNICKIRVDNMIFYPYKVLIDVVNSLLENIGSGIKLLEKENSGFVVGEILEHTKSKRSYIYKVDIKDKLIYAESSFDIPNGTSVVIATNNTYIAPGKMIQEYNLENGKKSGGRICTYDDLEILDVVDPYLPVVYKKEVGLEVGRDFFFISGGNEDA